MHLSFIWKKVNLWFSGLHTERRGRKQAEERRIVMCYALVPTPKNGCDRYVLQMCTDDNKKLKE